MKHKNSTIHKMRYLHQLSDDLLIAYLMSIHTHEAQADIGESAKSAKSANEIKMILCRAHKQ